MLRLGFDARGRKVAAGTARVRGPEGEATFSLWCEGSDAQVAWGIAERELPAIEIFAINPGRTELLVGTRKQCRRVDLESGTVSASDLSVPLHDPLWADDEALLGNQGGRCVRWSFCGEVSTPWEAPSGIVGRVQQRIENWYATTGSSLRIDPSGNDLLSTPQRPIEASAFRFVGIRQAGQERHVHVVGARVRLDDGSKADNGAWVCYDAHGRIVHRWAIELHGASTDAQVDGEGRLFVRGQVAENRWAIIRVDPVAGEAVTVAEAKTPASLSHFAIGPGGDVVLPSGDVSKRGGRSVPVSSRPPRHPWWGPAAVPIFAVLVLATIAMSVVRRSMLLDFVARGDTFETRSTEGRALRYAPEHLEVLVRGVSIQIVSSVVMLAGLFILASMARTTPARTAMVAIGWVAATQLLAAVVIAIATGSPTAAFDVATLSPAAPLVAIFGCVPLAAVAAKARS